MNIINHFYEQKDRWILWIPVFMALGIGIYFSLNFEPNIWLGISFLFISVLIIILLYVKRKNFLLLIPVFLFLLGFTAAQIQTHNISASMLLKKTYPLEIIATVSEIEALPNNEHRVLLKEISYKSKYNKMPQDDMPSAIRIKLKKGDHIIPFAGDKIKLLAILTPLSQPASPDAFDFQRYAFFKGFYATGFAISDAEILEQKKEQLLFSSLRRYLRDKIKKNIIDNDEGSITIALLDGEDRDISKETTEVVRKAGIAHLMAISGLQVALVTGLFFVILRKAMAAIPKFALHYPIKKIAAFAAMCGALFYMMLIGDSVSAERSVIMTCIVMWAIILDRDPFTLRLVAFAASFLLLSQPDSLFGASFQLSFAAVTALVAFYESTRNFWSTIYYERKWYSFIYINFLAVLLTTIIATIATAPFSLYHFSRTPLFPGLIANAVAVPLSSFVTIPFAIVGSILMPFGLEYHPLQVSAWSVKIILIVAKKVASWPYGMFYMTSWHVWILITIALGGVWICVWKEKMRWLGFVPIIIASLFALTTVRADVFIAANGGIFAVRDNNGKIYFSESRKEKFTREAWINSETKNNDYGFWRDEASPVKCDDYACIYNRKGRTISFIKDYLALEEDCKKADVVISSLYIGDNSCFEPSVVIDKKSLKHQGSHVIYIGEKGDITVKSNYSVRGFRPWTLY